MSILSFFGCGKKAPEYPADTLTTRDGTQITITFFRHASLSVEAGGKYIYVDPVSGYADYAALPKADVVLITHSHYDHLDVAAVEAIQTPQTEILCDRTSAEAFEMNCYTMRPGSVATPRDYLKVEAVAAYNTTDGHLQFHPKEREDCGYVLTIGGSRIYIAGDTEPTPELKALKNIDIAFLPVNQPYTMTVDQAVEAVKAIPHVLQLGVYGGQAGFHLIKLNGNGADRVQNGLQHFTIIHGFLPPSDIQYNRESLGCQGTAKGSGADFRLT